MKKALKVIRNIAILAAIGIAVYKIYEHFFKSSGIEEDVEELFDEDTAEE